MSGGDTIDTVGVQCDEGGAGDGGSVMLTPIHPKQLDNMRVVLSVAQHKVYKGYVLKTTASVQKWSDTRGFAIVVNKMTVRGGKSSPSHSPVFASLNSAMAEMNCFRYAAEHPSLKDSITYLKILRDKQSDAPANWVGRDGVTSRESFILFCDNYFNVVHAKTPLMSDIMSDKKWKRNKWVLEVA